MQSITRSLLLAILILFAIVSPAYPQCTPFYTFTGEAEFDELGWSVASAGDVNNDGYADLIVGAAFNATVNRDVGRAYVYSGLNGDTIYVFDGKARYDLFGISVASAGDVNKDGYDDLIIGAPEIDAGTGRAYVYSGLNGNALYVLRGEAVSDRFGWSVASAGDVDNDGYDDLIVGAYLNDAGGLDAGRVYVFSGFNGNVLHIFTGEATGDFFGRSVASAGDVNNDGHADLIMGAYLNDAGGTEAGRAFVFSGQNGDVLYVFSGKAPFNRFGRSVASAGDVNNDGFTDVIVGALFNDAGGGSSAGQAYVYSGLNGDVLYVLTGEAKIDVFGWSVASAGDVNADSYDDLIMGAPGNDTGGKNAGKAYVYLGGPEPSPCPVCGDVNGDFQVTQNDLDILLNFYFLSGDPPVPYEAGDINGDGVFDLSDIVYLAQFLAGIGPAPTCEDGDGGKKKPEVRRTAFE